MLLKAVNYSEKHLLLVAERWENAYYKNGDANLHLVLARSEEGTRDGRGLSMFIYDKNEGGVNVRRIENKLGIHGSPTL